MHHVSRSNGERRISIDQGSTMVGCRRLLFIITIIIIYMLRIFFLFWSREIPRLPPNIPFPPIWSDSTRANSGPTKKFKKFSKEIQIYENPLNCRLFAFVYSLNTYFFKKLSKILLIKIVIT